MNKSEPPKITVLMPVYNGEKFLREAIESILNQTFTDFELLIINDGSTDKSVEIIESYKDPRIRLLHNEKNKGLIYSLNRGIDLASGEYIARMDCDDISLPKRLEKQVAFMDAHPDVGASGTWIKKFGNSGSKVLFFPIKTEYIKCGFLFNCMLPHPSVMIRKKLFLRNNLYYDPAYNNAEDYELWVRCQKYFPLQNIGKILLLYRLHDEQVGERYYDEQLTSTRLVWQKMLKDLLIAPTREELDVHQSISTLIFEQSESFLLKSEKWLSKLKSANDTIHLYSDRAFENFIIEKWIKCCYKAKGISISSAKRFLTSEIYKKSKKRNIIINIIKSFYNEIRNKFYLVLTRDKFKIALLK